MTLVQHIVPSSTERRVVLGMFEHDVEAWDLGTRRQVAAFATRFDFGGRRLALSDQLDLVFAGAYRRHGLSAHDVSTVIIWDVTDGSVRAYPVMDERVTRLWAGAEADARSRLRRVSSA